MEAKIFLAIEYEVRVFVAKEANQFHGEPVHFAIDTRLPP